MAEGNRRALSFGMKKFFALAVLPAAILPAAVWAGEAWQPLYEDGLIRVAIDVASLSRASQAVRFREREIFLKPLMDPAAMRPIREIQYRRQADCASRRLSVLSRAVFSKQGALMHYEAIQPAVASWGAPRTERELKLLDAVCGAA